MSSLRLNLEGGAMQDTATERGRLVPEGMGGFLNPPTHPEHSWSVETDLRRRKENRGGMSLSSAADCEWLDAATRDAAQRKLDEWKRPALDSEEIQDWIAQVLGYFRNCYKGNTDGEYGRGPWSAEALSIEPKTDPVLNADLHAGVHLIRAYYPEFVPTAADFKRAHWGTEPVADVEP